MSPTPGPERRPLSVREAIAIGAGMLEDARVLRPEWDAQLLMRATLGISSAQLIARELDMMDSKAETAFFASILQRAKRIPMAHLLGFREFYKHRFIVTPDVLDPRPDTETLIELALAEPFSELLDLGTGSGAIILSLLAEQTAATGVATDISQPALEIAARNAQAIGVQDRLHLELSNWFDTVGGTYDLIVSNPPYISQNAYETLAPELHYEPKIALTPGGDGLEPYRIIARDAPAHLAPNGRLMVEIGFDQGPQVAQLVRAAGLEDVTIHPDLNGKDRVVSARKPAK